MNEFHNLYAPERSHKSLAQIHYYHKAFLKLLSASVERELILGTRAEISSAILLNNISDCTVTADFIFQREHA